jgi:hypothetical protein
MKRHALSNPHPSILLDSRGPPTASSSKESESHIGIPQFKQAINRIIQPPIDSTNPIDPTLNHLIPFYLCVSLSETDSYLFCASLFAVLVFYVASFTVYP